MDRNGSKANRRKRLTLAAMSLGYGVVQLDVTIVNVAANSIGRSFAGGIAALQWVVTSYTIAFAAFILTAGALGDRVGAKRVFASGFAIFTGASLACALAPSLAFLIASRAIQGIGAAILVPNSLALLNHAFSEVRERTSAITIWAAGASTALTSGPLVGGALIVALGWRSIFLVNVPIGLAAIWLTSRYTTETPALYQRNLDLGGQAAAVIGLGCLAGAIIGGGRFGWTNALVLVGFAAAAFSLTLFIMTERRSAQPMLPLSLFHSRVFTLTSAVGLLVNVAFYGLIFALSLYFQQANHLSPLWTGLAFVPMLGAVLMANLLVPRIAPAIGGSATIAIGAGTMGIACFTLLRMTPGTPYIYLLGQFVALGAGLGLLVPPLTAMLLGSVDKSRSGVASAVLNSMRQIGSVIGVALFGSMISTHQLPLGLHISLVFSIVLLGVSALSIMFARASADARNSCLAT